MIRVLVCEDEPLVRRCLVEMLSLEDGINVVGEAADGRTAVSRAAELQPDVVLMDIEMPVMNGIEATRVISGQHAGTRVVILTSHDSQSQVVDCLESGALGYVTKCVDPEIIVSAIRTAHDGEPYIEPALTGDAFRELLKNLPPPARDHHQRLLPRLPDTQRAITD